MQREVNTAGSSGVVQNIINTADASITGIEVDGRVAIADSWLATFNVGMIDASYDEVFFDLDGTLVDTAPDMAAALDILCAEENRAPLPYAQVRPVVSNGSLALIRLAFGDVVDEQRRAYLKQRYLDIYQRNLCIASALFDGIEGVLEHIERNGLNWGVVTNKPGWLTCSTAFRE